MGPIPQPVKGKPSRRSGDVYLDIHRNSPLVSGPKNRFMRTTRQAIHGWGNHGNSTPNKRWLQAQRQSPNATGLEGSAEEEVV